MIWESEYWKAPLLDLADKFSDWQNSQQWNDEEDEESLVNLEKDIFVAFYSIRKLMEAKKLTDSIDSLAIALSSYPSRGKNVTYLNWHKVDQLYDFDVKETQVRELRFVCNQIVHSYVFMPVINEEGRLEHILFCSDHERNKCIYEIEINELIRIFRSVGNDDPSSATYIFDSKKRDYKITQT